MSHISLIPTTGTQEGINDYRPITLLNCVLKIVTKLLANRLQKVVLTSPQEPIWVLKRKEHPG
jgi:hypothetical protein